MRVSNPLRCDGSGAEKPAPVAAKRFLIHFGAMGAGQKADAAAIPVVFLIHFGAMGAAPSTGLTQGDSQVSNPLRCDGSQNQEA